MEKRMFGELLYYAHKARRSLIVGIPLALAGITAAVVSS